MRSWFNLAHRQCCAIELGKKEEDISCRNCNGRIPKASNQGIALLVALFTLLVVTLFGLAMTSLGIIEVAVSTNERKATKVVYIAESGAVHAQGIIFSQNPDFTMVLQAGDGTACTGDELATNVADPIASKAMGGHTFGPEARYEVHVCDDPDETDGDPNVDTNSRIVVRSDGFGSDDSTATVEIVIGSIPLPGIAINGSLRISGAPTVNGPGGAIHSNMDIDVSGSPSAEQFVSAGGGITVSGSVSTGTPPAYGESPPDVRPASPTIEIPTINPADFQLMADYVLTIAGGICYTNGVAGEPTGWSCDTGNLEWAAGTNIPPGTYYTPDNVVISGNPGEGIGGISLTILAGGFVDISGYPLMDPDLITAGVGYAVVAGTDLKIGGGPGNPYTGAFVAGHQIDFTGFPVINGQVLAQDEDDFGTPQNLVEREVDGYTNISGSPMINTSGTGLTQKYLAGWREVRQ